MNDDLTPPCKAEEGKFSGGDGKDELLDCELEAAQALACLAHPGSRSDEFLVSGPSGRSEEQVITIQSEQESEPKTSPQHALNCPPGSSRRSRQNLTEAMYEELTRKAADLSSEKENLKKKKELATKEYHSLKNENATLRRQISKIEKAEAGGKDGASRSKPVEISTISTAPILTPTPTSLFKQPPILPFFWPSIVQPFNLLQCSTQNISDIASVMPSPTAGELNSISRQQISNPGNPLYVLPFPCLIPFLPWASTVTEKHAETSSAHQCCKSYVNMENNQAVTVQETEKEAVLGFPPDWCASEGRRQPSGVRSRDMVSITGTSGQIDTHPQDDTPDTNAVSCTVELGGDTSEKTSQESITCSREKTADAIAATEARKRRKEPLHWKGHHSDQFGPHH